MKHLKYFNESFSNISKIRNWPKTSNGSPDYYFVYDLKSDQIGSYLNTWFKGSQINSPENKPKYKNRKGVRYVDEIITLKKTDKETTDNLYRRKYNPLSIVIYSMFGSGDSKMKASIKSIDDSSFTIWWDINNLEELESIRKILMAWIDNSGKKGINGNKFLEKCIELGANKNTIDYN